jgi:riboflavin synthase alpha subunit
MEAERISSNSNNNQVEIEMVPLTTQNSEEEQASSTESVNLEQNNHQDYLEHLEGHV